MTDSSSAAATYEPLTSVQVAPAGSTDPQFPPAPGYPAANENGAPSAPAVRLVAALFEPRAPDSFAAWGLFNACFEQKEQMEPYVAEQIAAQMMAADPALRAEFAAKLEADPFFAASPSDRLEFFLRRHVSWDERYNLYPVMRVDLPL